ncbi:hypothetical protein [Flavisolibacter nicotianae]|uniref:hypothetical protein n=1 Tax=Flavisolibacter nicotianae TaxID=2364882 RepID=UPI000EB2016C|nr:hypothetical protein [Flavisolibacter nicotianae]
MFWKRKKKEGEGQAASSLFTSLLVRFNRKLVWLADHLQHRSNGLPKRTLKLLLGVFCLLFVSASAYVLTSSVKEKGLPFHITPIKAMPLAVKPVQVPLKTEGEFRRIHRLRLSLDSLSRLPGEKVHLDSLLKRYPGILDTLSLLERLYYEQHKN